MLKTAANFELSYARKNAAQGRLGLFIGLVLLFFFLIRLVGMGLRAATGEVTGAVLAQVAVMVVLETLAGVGGTVVGGGRGCQGVRGGAGQATMG